MAHSSRFCSLTAWLITVCCVSIAETVLIMTAVSLHSVPACICCTAAQLLQDMACHHHCCKLAGLSSVMRIAEACCNGCLVGLSLSSPCCRSSSFCSTCNMLLLVHCIAAAIPQQVRGPCPVCDLSTLACNRHHSQSKPVTALSIVCT